MAERKSVLLRISPELWKELQRLAEQDFRSVNAQIEFLLRESVAKRRSKPLKESEETDSTNS